MGYPKCQKSVTPQKPRDGNRKTGHFFFLVNSTISWSTVCIFRKEITEASPRISNPDVSIKWIIWNGIFSLFEQNHVSAAHNERCPHDAFRCEKVFITAMVESLYYSLALSAALSFLLGWNSLPLKKRRNLRITKLNKESMEPSPVCMAVKSYHTRKQQNPAQGKKRRLTFCPLRLVFFSSHPPFFPTHQDG